MGPIVTGEYSSQQCLYGPPGCPPSMGRIVPAPSPQQIAVTLYWTTGWGSSTLTRNQGYSPDFLRSIKVPPFRGFNHALRISEGFWITIFARGFSLTWDNQRKAFCAERRIVNDSPKRWEILVAEAFRRLASQWCHAADYVADLERRSPRELTSVESNLPRVWIGCPKLPEQFPAPRMEANKNPPRSLPRSTFNARARPSRPARSDVQSSRHRNP